MNFREKQKNWGPGLFEQCIPNRLDNTLSMVSCSINKYQFTEQVTKIYFEDMNDLSKMKQKIRQENI